MSYASEVLADSPWLYWHLDDTTSTAADASGNGRTGSHVGSPTLEQESLVPSDPSGKSVLYNDTDKWTISTALLNSTTATVECWFDYLGTPPIASQRFQVAGFINGEGSSTVDKTVYIQENGKAGFYAFDGSGKFATGDTVLSAGTYHLVGVADGTDIRIYVNGVLDGTPTACGATYAGYSVPNLIVAGSYSTSPPTRGPGRRDEFAVYSNALSAARILAHYEAGIEQLIGYQRLYGPAQLATSAADLYTVPTGSLVRLRKIYANNPSGAEVEFTCQIAPGYMDAVLLDDPIGYWRLGEPSGTTAVSEVNSPAVDGTYVNTPTLGVTGAVVGDSDTAATFAAGSQERVTITPAGAMEVGNIFTIEFFIKGFSTIGAVYIHGGGNGYPRVMISNGIVVLELWTGDNVATSSSIVPDDGGWHHIAVTKSGPTSHIYIDGVDKTVPATDTTFTTTGTNIYLASTDATDHLSGTLDEFAIYPTALSAARIRAHYQAAVAGSPTFYDQFPVPAGGSLEWAYDHALVAGETLQAFSDTDSTLVLVVDAYIEPV